MPIDVDRLDGDRELPTSARVVRFLAAHDDRAFTRREIADAVGADPETVGTNLSRLKARGLVRHREPHWAFTDDREGATETLRARYDDAVVDDLVGAAHTDGLPPSDGTDQREAAPSPHREAASAFAERVRDRLDDAVDALYLFGSVRRGTATADSDVDVLAVVAADADYAAVDDELLDVAYDVQLDYGVRVEVHSIGADEFAARRERGDPFVSDAVGAGALDG